MRASTDTSTLGLSPIGKELNSVLDLVLCFPQDHQLRSPDHLMVDGEIMSCSS